MQGVLLLLILSLIGLVINKTLFYFFVPKVYEDGFVYSIPLLYTFFFLFSGILILILEKVKQNNIDTVGYTFLLLTTLKMVVAYLFLRPILSGDLPKTPTEKINFFVIFIYFLAMETYVTIRILNNKQ